LNNSEKNIDKAKHQAIKKLQASIQVELSVSEIAKEIKNKNRTALGRGITLVESSNPDFREKGKQLVNLLHSDAGNSMRIGITGVPGVGKSTFIESLGIQLINQGKRVAVLAIDPSSQKSHGSILGDKTRMEKLAANEMAFIRPTPSAEALGGVARSTQETIILCEAAGYDVVIVETVGVGQSEIDVHSITDFFLLLMLAGAGDELQGIKRGIMEMADAITITKADGDNFNKSQQAVTAFKTALHFFPPSEDEWTPRVTLCSALENIGLTEIWEIISEHHRHLTTKGWLQKKRANQAVFWFNRTLEELWRRQVLNEPQAQELKLQLEREIRNGQKNPFDAAQEMANKLWNN
jgi:LAO/AO transport system kinase